MKELLKEIERELGYTLPQNILLKKVEDGLKVEARAGKITISYANKADVARACLLVKANADVGDFGEYMHDGNFCIDGIVSPDREIKAGTLSMKKVYQPLTFKKDGEVLTVFNKQYFAPLAGKLVITQADGESALSVAVSPRESVQIPCKAGSLTVACYMEGEEVAREQFYEEAVQSTAMTATAVTFENKGSKLLAKTENGEYLFDITSGELLSSSVNGANYGKLALSVWRAPIDNERNLKGKWIWHHLPHAYGEVTSKKISGNVLTFNLKIVTTAYRPFVEMTLAYTFYKEGVEMDIRYALSNTHYFDYLPRIGFNMTLDKSYKDLSYLAYGPEETYSDCHNFAWKGVYKSEVKDEYFHYVKPQESGSHYGSDWAELTDGKHTLRVEGMYSFSAIPYSATTIENTAHDDELPESDGIYLSVDIASSGVGSNACGPRPLDKYLVPEKGGRKIRLIFR